MIILYYRRSDIRNGAVCKTYRDSTISILREIEEDGEEYDHWLEADVPSYVLNCVTLDSDFT